MAQDRLKDTECASEGRHSDGQERAGEAGKASSDLHVPGTLPVNGPSSLACLGGR